MERFIIKTGLWSIGKALQTASKLDAEIKRDLRFLPDGFTISLQVYPQIAAVNWQKVGDKIKFLGTRTIEKTDLKVVIKSKKAALRMILAQAGIAKSYAQRRIAIEGNTVDAMVLTRMLDKVEAYLFPKFLSKNLLKQHPHFGLKEYFNNILIYLSLPF